MRHPVFFIILLLASFSVVAQENEPVPDFKMPRTLIKIAPLQFFRNTFELGIESFDKNYKRSANLDLGYRSGSGDWEDARGFHGEIGYRRYAPAMVLKKKGDENFYRGIYYGITVRSEYFSGGTDESALHDYDMKGKYCRLHQVSFLGGKRRYGKQLFLIFTWVGVSDSQK